MEEIHKDLFDKIEIYIAAFLRLTLIVAIALGILEQRWVLVFSTLMILILTFVPMMIERKYKLYLPIELQFIVIVFIYASLYLGSINNYYTLFWWWDIVLHISSGIALGFSGFLILYILYSQNKIVSNPVWIAVFSFCFALAIGALWEIVEFSMDQLFGLHTQPSLVDTMWDLIVDALGALLTSFIGYFYFRGKKVGIFNRVLTRFIKLNPRYFKKMMRN